MADQRWDQTNETLGEGLHRLALPLPGDALKAVNVYVIESNDGLTLIDAGWDDEGSRQALQTGLTELGFELGDVRRVLVTHLHGDHYGQGTYLARTAGSQVALGEHERESLTWFIGNPRGTIEERHARLHVAGAEEMLPELRASEPDLSVDWDLPARYLRDAEVIEAGDRRLEIVHTPGHTKGHVCFHEREAGWLFSGDHVLPHITPSIGFEPKPTDHSLADFLSSLSRVRDLPAARVLPAHGPVFDDLEGRIDELASHHEVRLEASLEALTRGAETAYEVARLLPWTRRERRFEELNLFNRMLATLETLAHLELLASQGRASRTGDDVARFGAAAKGSSPGSADGRSGP
ncbi:MBL fold metallo-hydrolase [Nitriliruptoraceae bacterium ZYF776]|nr:MBL fold metallo-hydrolase [Profundirhabdus halotolerans]